MSRNLVLPYVAVALTIAGAALFATTPPVHQTGSRSAWAVPRAGYALSYASLNDPHLRAYMAERQGCAGLPLSQQAQCQAEVNAKFPAIDAGCQKKDGIALADCLRARDRENQALTENSVGGIEVVQPPAR